MTDLCMFSYVEDKVINLSYKVQKYQICNYDIEGFADITGGKEIFFGGKRGVIVFAVA